MRRLVNQGVALLGRCFGRDDWALYTAFARPRAHVTTLGAVTEAVKRRRDEPDPHRDDASRFRELDDLYENMDLEQRQKLDDDVAFLVSRAFSADHQVSTSIRRYPSTISAEQVSFLRYRLLYMRFADRFPSRPLDVAATGLMNAVRDIDYNYEGIIKSFQVDPTRGYGSANEFDRASRRLVLESWVRSDDMYMTASAAEMRFLGGHPTAGMHRPDDVPVLTRQIEMVHNRCASVSSRRRRASFGVFFGRRFAVRLLLDVAPAPARPPSPRRAARHRASDLRRRHARREAPPRGWTRPASRPGPASLPSLRPLEHRQGPRDVGDVAGVVSGASRRAADSSARARRRPARARGDDDGARSRRRGEGGLRHPPPPRLRRFASPAPAPRAGSARVRARRGPRGCRDHRLRRRSPAALGTRRSARRLGRSRATPPRSDPTRRSRGTSTRR